MSSYTTQRNGRPLSYVVAIHLAMQRLHNVISAVTI
jgi:hypothetical protein